MKFSLVRLAESDRPALRQFWLKPSIPELGLDGIPIRDELELELRLTPSTCI